MKKSVTTYNLSSIYTDRRIIGLPSMVESWGYDDLTSSLEYVGKVTYAYDEGDFSGSGQNVSPTKHASGYGSTFIAGRKEFGVRHAIMRFLVSEIFYSNQHY